MIETQSGIVTKLLVPIPSLDGTISAEVSLIERPTKNIICFSTQIGCAIKCKFCASGKSDGPVRNLSFDDMKLLVDVAIGKAKDLSKWMVVSAMGEGEPAQNYKAVGEILWLYDKRGYKTAVSTSGPSLSLVRKLIHALPPATKIQYSLHSATQKRRRIIDGPTVDPGIILSELADLVTVELNVVLWQGINTSIDEIQALMNLLRRHGGREPWYIKLNRANYVEGGLTPATEEVYHRWAELMRGYGFNVEYYETDGSNINAACGQLRAQHTGA